MLTTDDLNLNEYIFQSSPESCSDRSYSTDFMDVTSDEDFLTQLSLDLDIPLYLNPGEDELGLLNSHFDKSPEEILSEITSPPYIMEGYSKEDNELKNIEFATTYNPPKCLKQQYIVKSESSCSSGSEKSNSPVQLDLIIKEEIQIKTPPLSPASVMNNSRIKDFQNKIIYTQPLQILTSHHGNLSTVSPKEIPIVPKTQVSLPKNQNKLAVLNTEVKSSANCPQSAKVIVVENVNLCQKIPHIKVEPITPLTSVNVSNVMVNSINTFSTSMTIDPRILKKQQRKIKNRESASLSRKRKKDYMTSLEEQVKGLSAENKRLQIENAQLKQKLAQYKDVTYSKSKAVKPSIFLCVVLLLMGVNLDLIRNPLRNKNQFSIIKNSLPRINDHRGRNLLWTPEEKQNTNNTSRFSPFTMCPAAINQTESARLVLELERWIGKPAENTVKDDINQNSTKEIKKKRKKLKFDGTLTSVYRRHRSKNGHQENFNPLKTAIQVFSTSPEQIYSDFFEAINRQDDTFYVVSFTDQHMLLPALHHNKTRRPKMSLIMPSVLLNDSVAQNSMVPLMQIDCEVLDTRLIHVKHESIPAHLRTYANVSKEKPPTENSSFANTDIPKYYRKSYIPYFINKKEMKANRGFLNINLN